MNPYEDIATISSVPKINLHSGSTKAEKRIPDLITFFLSPGELLDVVIDVLNAFQEILFKHFNRRTLPMT